jgi:hypothetical protein
MQVDALPISIAKQAASSAPNPLPSTSFGAALVSSISGSVPEHLRGHTRATASVSKFYRNLGANADTSVDSESRSNNALSRGGNASCNSGKLSSKSVSKADANATANSPFAEAKPTFLPTALLLTLPFQSSTNPPITAETLPSAPPNLATASSASDEQLPARQPTETLAYLRASSLPIPQLMTDLVSSTGTHAAINGAISGFPLPGDSSAITAPTNSSGSAATVYPGTLALSSTSSQGKSSSANFFSNVSIKTFTAPALYSTSFGPGAPATTANAPFIAGPLIPSLPMSADLPIIDSSAPIPSSARTLNPTLSTDPAFDTSPPPALFGTLTPVAASIPILQPSASVKLAAATNPTDSSVGHSRDNPVPGKAAQSNSSAAERLPTSGPAASEASPAATQTADGLETGFVISSNIVTNDSNNNAPFLISNSNSRSSTPASTAQPGNDVPSASKLGMSAQLGPAAATPATVADKKLNPTLQSAATSSTATQSATPPWHDIAVPVAPGGTPSATFTTPAPSASAAAPQLGSDPAPSLPQTHQMLDSAAPSPAPPAPSILTDPTSPQLNAQMHLGLRTDAFGTVEIHTVVQQSQIGITVHADRDISRWFTSEVPGLEAGLNHQHLNLVAVDFDSARSGVQTASSFQHGQPRQHFSETHDSRSSAQPDQNKRSEPAIIDTFPTDPFVGLGLTRVNIHA